MKKYLIWLFSILIGIPYVGNAQKYQDSSRSDWNVEMGYKAGEYKALREHILKQYNSFEYMHDKEEERKEENGSNEECEDFNYMQFERWDQFWRWRLTPEDPNMKEKSSSTAKTNSSTCSNSSVSASWSLLGPTNMAVQTMGLVCCVQEHPTNQNIIFASTNNSGLWKTTDGGQNWTNITDGINDALLGIRSFKIHPTNPNIILIGANGRSNVGVFRTTDGGLTWSTTSLNFTNSPAGFTKITKILFDPNNSNIVYVLAQRDLYRSTDGGITFTSIYNHPCPNIDPCWDKAKYAMEDVEILPSNSNVLFVTSVPSGSLCDNAHMIKLVYNGTNWTSTDITPANPVLFERIELAVTPANPNVVYVLAGDTSTSSFHVQSLREYNNTTSSFSTPIVPSGTDMSFWWNEFAVSPTDKNVMYHGNTVLYKSVNGGLNWSPITTYSAFSGTSHGDIRGITIVSGSTAGTSGAQDRLLIGTDGGVLKSLNGGSTWYNINGNGLSISQFFGIAQSESNPDLIIGGLQDNGIEKYNAGAWINTGVLADAYDGVIDITDNNYMYVCLNNGTKTLHKSTNGGSTWATMNQPPGASLSTRPILMHEGDKKLYTGYHDVWECANPKAASVTWTQLSNFANPKDVIGALAIAPSDPNVIYTAMTKQVYGGIKQNLFYKSTNHGSTWVDISANIPALEWHSIRCISIDPNNPNRVWIGYDGYRTDLSWRVLYTSNGGITWSDFSSGLPGFIVNDLIYEKGTNDGLYAATDVGVYYRNADMSSWVCYNDAGLPRCIIMDLEINYSKNVLRAATFGRGLWQTRLACPTTLDQTLTGTQSVNRYYEVKNNIYSTQNITASNVTYRAGTRIELNPGFNSAQVNKFVAHIHPCDMIGNSPYLKQMDQTNFNELLQWGKNEPTENLKSTSSSDQIEIIPNPNNGRFNILLPKDQAFDVKIYDLRGTVVYSQKSEINNKMFVDLSMLSAGMYFIKASSNSINLTQKVILK